MYNLDAEKKTRQKFILAAGVVVVVIIALIVAIASVASNKPKKGSIADNNGSSIIDDNTASTGSDEVATGEKTDDASEDEAETDADDNAEASDNGTSIFGTVVTTRDTSSTTGPKGEPVVETATNLPNTGPEDYLPLALVLGLITASATAFVLSEKKVRERGM